MSYIIREKLLAFGNDSTIRNEKGQPVFDVDGKALSVLNTIVVRDMEKNKVVTIKQKLPSISPTYEITREGQESAKISKQLISPFADRFTVNIPGPGDLNIKGSTNAHPNIHNNPCILPLHTCVISEPLRTKQQALSTSHRLA